MSCNRCSQGCAGNHESLGTETTNVAVLEHCVEKTFQVMLVSQTDYELHPLTTEDQECAGPGIEDLISHVEVTNFRGAEIAWNVGIQSRYRSGKWGPVTKLWGTDNTGNSDIYLSSTALNDRTKFGIKVRLVLMLRLVTNGTAGERADFSISSALRMFAS
jgi:hypothetical protein